MSYPSSLRDHEKILYQSFDPKVSGGLLSLGTAPQIRNTDSAVTFLLLNRLRFSASAEHACVVISANFQDDSDNMIRRTTITTHQIRNTDSYYHLCTIDHKTLLRRDSTTPSTPSCSADRALSNELSVFAERSRKDIVPKL